MTPVSVIEGKELPGFERSIFSHSGCDQLEVVNDDFFVRVKYTSTSSLVVAPRSEKFGGKMVVRVACHFSNKG